MPVCQVRAIDRLPRLRSNEEVARVILVGFSGWLNGIRCVVCFAPGANGRDHILDMIAIWGSLQGYSGRPNRRINAHRHIGMDDGSRHVDNYRDPVL